MKKLNRRGVDYYREKAGFRDPSWEYYTTVGPTLEEVLTVKPTRLANIKSKSDNPMVPSSLNAWEPEKGWYRNERPSYHRPNGGHNGEVPESGGKPTKRRRNNSSN